MAQGNYNQNRGGGDRNRPTEPDVPKLFVAKWKEKDVEQKVEFNENWIKEKITNETLQYAEKFGEHLCDLQPDKRLGRMAMTTSQIRNIFGEVKRIQAKGYNAEKPTFLLLRPKVAYAEARVLVKSGKSRISDFRIVLDKAHIAVTDEKQFQNFVDFMEAILAYHKAYGGRD